MRSLLYCIKKNFPYDISDKNVEIICGHVNFYLYQRDRYENKNRWTKFVESLHYVATKCDQ
jgi:hypothetical protein